MTKNPPSGNFIPSPANRRKKEREKISIASQPQKRNQKRERKKNSVLRYLLPISVAQPVKHSSSTTLDPSTSSRVAQIKPEVCPSCSTATSDRSPQGTQHRSRFQHAAAGNFLRVPSPSSCLVTKRYLFSSRVSRPLLSFSSKVSFRRLSPQIPAFASARRSCCPLSFLGRPRVSSGCALPIVAVI